MSSLDQMESRTDVVTVSSTANAASLNSILPAF
jgi:hypothetical protein